MNLIFVCILSAVICYAQHSPYRITRYSKKDGLTSNKVMDVLQTRDGYLRIATEDGLATYNGKTFKTIKHNPEMKDSPSTNRMHNLYEDSKQNLWIGTLYSGLMKYNLTDKTYTFFKGETKHPNRISDNDIHTVKEDWNQNIWVATHNGLNKISPDTNKITTYYIKKDAPKNPLNWMYGIEFESDTSMWIGMYEGLAQFNPVRETFRLLSLKTYLGERGRVYTLYSDSEYLWIFSSVGIFTLNKSTQNIRQVFNRTSYCYFKRKDHTLWVGSQKMLFLFDMKTKSVLETYTHDPNNPNSLSDCYRIESIWEDQSGIVWTSSERGGLNKLNRTTANFSHFMIKPSSSLNQQNNVYGIYEDSLYRWMGTRSSGLFRYSKRLKKTEHISELSKHVGSIFHISYIKNTLWLSTDRGVWLLNPATLNIKQLPQTEELGVVFQTLEFSGTVWLATYSGLFRYKEAPLQVSVPNTSEHDLFTQSAYTLAVDRKDSLIWFGTEYGLNAYHLKSKRVSHYCKDGTEGLKYNFIRYLFMDSQQRLWVGSYGGGLYLHSKTDDTFTPITVSDGLPDNSIKAIIEDGRGYIWVSTNSGLAEVSYKNRLVSIQNYSVQDGIQGYCFNSSSVFRTKKNTLVFGGETGVTLFNPSRMKKNTHPPQIQWDKITRMTTPLNPSEYESKTNTNTYTYTNHTFEFSFSALDFVAPDKNRYRYQLSGFETKWHTASAEQTRVRYTNLDPGKYVFNVFASNSSGIWSSRPKQFSFTITPPFWQTLWFRASCVFLILCGLWCLYKLRVRFLEKQKLLLQEQVDAQTLELKEKSEKLETLDALKTTFFTNISHELRTPLTLIVSPLENYVQHSKQLSKDVLDMMHQHSKKLLELINDLLDISSIDHHKEHIRLRPYNLHTYLNDKVEQFNSHSLSDSATFHFTSDAEYLPVQIDLKAFDKVIDNLFTNAEKYSFKNHSIHIQLHHEQTKAILSVTNSGKTIPSEELPYLFDRFYRGKTDRPGSGIGLSIVKEYLDLHQGTISVQSENEKTTFTLMLPLASPVSRKEEIAVEENKPSIVFIEDHPDLNSFVTQELSDFFNVYSFFNVKDAQGYISENDVQLVISDVMLPDISGFQFTERLKKNPATSHIPIILLTAKSSDAEKMEGLSYGADDYITKPFQISEVRLKCHNILQTRHAYQTRFNKELLFEPTTEKLVTYDEEFLNKVIQIIEQNIASSEFDVRALSDTVGLSTSALYRKIKSLTGYSTNEFIRILKLKYAKGLLETTDHSIGDVAYLSGFKYESHFTKNFKLHFGKTPSSFRKETSVSLLK